MREQHGSVYINICKQIPVGIFCVTQGAQTGVCDSLEGKKRREAGGGGGRGHIYTYGEFMRMCGRNQTYTANQSLS